jgi:hypothetical protein
MKISRCGERSALGLVIALFVVLGALYATRTPLWQAPDEPAHFNYVAHLATDGGFPVLQQGDYPHQYLEEIKAARFPPDMPTSSLRYEAHQPPLYYLLATPVYLATASLGLRSQVVALRLFSVGLGVAGLWVLHRVAQEVFTEAATNSEHDKAALPALIATASVAVLPMHIAVSASINNDLLGQLVLLCILLYALRTMRGGLDSRRGWGAGLLLGIAFLTKTTIYLPAVGVLGLSAFQATTEQNRERSAARALVGYLGRMLLVAAALAGPWFVRNVFVYGGLDLFAWQRHDAVVLGQLRTQDLLAQTGLGQYVLQFARTTFRSFWGQFGWMGVLADERVYMGLAVLSGMLTIGFAHFLLRVWRGEIRLTTFQTRTFWLLSIAAALSVVTYLGYNLKFVQHQGRYLFTALGPLAVAVAISVLELMTPRLARAAALVLLLAASAGTALGALTGDLPSWSVLLLLAAAAWMTVTRWLPSRWAWLSAAALYLALMALNPILVYRFIVPALTIAPVSP